MEQEEVGSRIKPGMTDENARLSTPDRGLGQAPRGTSRDGGNGRIHAGRHRDIQIARTGARKLFDVPAKTIFLEWFAATCNLSWAAEMAGFNYKTVLRHRMNDPDFAAD